MKGFLLTFLALFTINFASASVPQINVLIGKSLPKVTIKGFNLKRKFKGIAQSRLFRGKNTVVFNCEEKNQQFKNIPIVASLKTSNELIKWNDSTYKGELLLTSQPGKNSCDLVMKTSLERYISLLLTKEMHPNWPLEALKAQAVAARTYALYQMKKKNDNGDLFHLENSEKHQVNGSLEDESEKTKQASFDTAGEILVHGSGELQPIFYHAKCGGRTLLPSEVWGGYVRGYKSVACPFCFNHGQKSFHNQMSRAQFSDLLRKLYVYQFGSSFFKKNYKEKTPIYAYNDSPFNRTGKIFFAGKTQNISKPLLRKIAGRNLIPSNNYTISVEGDQVHFRGRGLGHGVGLCQLGALELARRGYSYRDILSYYFPNHRIANMYKEKYL
ncbi:MAG: SpoIID/LytB domain-containing protein [Halobacteriovoraceae bacterium]|nr:SpoIID/LytB domain-containing protein [Halobacteriovoraceae bacterium]MCB9094209.1 SpoIID/LytB domain-containing protein [Halobacteriovoraceae bacterium]